MTEARYEDPLCSFSPGPTGPKIAVVVTSFIPNGPKDYLHFVEDKAETLKMTLACHKKYDPGIPYTLIVVDHGGADPLVRGEKCLLVHMENKGFSFGGWKQAWEFFGDDFDYYLFTEDDIAPAKDGWLADIFVKFNSDPEIGAVGNVVEARSSTEPGSDIFYKLGDFKREMMYNLDGAYTFTSTKILEEVESIGGLPVFDCREGTDIPPTANEVLFQQPILELGYKIVAFDDRFLVHGSEIFTNDVLTRPYWPKVAPMLNLNGRWKIPEVKDHYAWYEKTL